MNLIKNIEKLLEELKENKENPQYIKKQIIEKRLLKRVDGFIEEQKLEEVLKFTGSKEDDILKIFDKLKKKEMISEIELEKLNDFTDHLHDGRISNLTLKDKYNFKRNASDLISISDIENDLSFFFDKDCLKIAIDYNSGIYQNIVFDLKQKTIRYNYRRNQMNGISYEIYKKDNLICQKLDIKLDNKNLPIMFIDEGYYLENIKKIRIEKPYKKYVFLEEFETFKEDFYIIDLSFKMSKEQLEMMYDMAYEE